MKKYTPEIRDFIKKYYEKGARSQDICGMVNARFGTDFTEIAIISFITRAGIRKRRAYPVGYEKVNSKGFRIVKIAMSGPKRTLWKTKQRLVWEKARGPIPEKHVVVFLDGDRRNCALENLALLTIAERIRMNQFGFFSNNRAVTLAGIAAVKHLMAVHGRIEKMLGAKEHRKFINKAAKERLKKKKKSSGVCRDDAARKRPKNGPEYL